MLRSTALFAVVALCAFGCDKKGYDAEDADVAASAPADDPALVDRSMAGRYYRAFAYHCPSPSCGWQVTELNHDLMDCPAWTDPSPNCHVTEFDWSRLSLSAQEIADIENQADATGSVLVRGGIKTIADPNYYGGYRYSFVASEVWLGGTEATASGTFARETDNGIVCVAYPCDHLDEHVLNRTTSRTIADLDFDASTATADQQQEAWDATFDPYGVVVAGALERVSGPGGAGRARTVTEYYTRYAP
jgi:hypothetical protein